jgi:hypothetical protein
MTDLSRERPDFPEAFDSTMLRTFRSCPRKYELEYLNHWKPATESIHLTAGGAYAKGLETTRLAYYRDGKSKTQAINEGLIALIEEYGEAETPEDSPKTWINMGLALVESFHQYDLDDDPFQPHRINGEPVVEFSFALP